MSNFEKKEQNLNQLIDKLNSMALSYSQPSHELKKIKNEKNELANKKKEIEKQNQELMREHRYLKEKIKKLQIEVNKKSELEARFNQDIDELSQETESLVREIDKWQM
jgi:peptidoglycan hydrolase CwlO-like protein